MPFITVGTENSAPIDLYYEDHGSGKPVVLIHGFPFNGATWEKETRALQNAGYRTITYDRRGYGNSAQPAFGYDYNTFAADLDVLMTELDLNEVTLIGHSMGTGEVVRYLGNYGSQRVSRAVLLSPLQPMLAKASDNPEGVDRSLFKGFQDAIIKDRFAYLTSSATRSSTRTRTWASGSARRRTGRTGRSARWPPARPPTTVWTPGRRTSAPTCRRSTFRC